MTATDDAQTELRERRRAKILASKDARMARITGTQKGTSQESLLVDEIVLQEFIAEGKKQAVELAKEDYVRTHVEHENEADEVLTPAEVKQRQVDQFKEKLEKLHENSPVSKIDIFISSFVVVVSGISAAFFLFKRTEKESQFCLNLAVGALNYSKIQTCRQALLPVILQTVPGSFVVSLLPLVSDFFKKTKSLPEVILGIFPRVILYLVTLLITLRIITACQ